jgi:hypothetical protein
MGYEGVDWFHLIHVLDSCEHGNETLKCIKGEKCLEKIKEY